MYMRTVRTFLPATAVVIALLLSSASYVSADDDVTVTPASPSTTDFVQITVTGELPSTCWAPQSFHSVQPGQITVQVGFTQVSEVCLFIVTPFTAVIDIGQLAEGPYDVQVRIYSPAVGCSPWCIRQTSFEVTGVDSDGDGFNDGVDNCPSLANPSQSNNDGDAYGDDCDSDDDNDGFSDTDETYIGTDALDECGLHTTTLPIYSLAWPADVFSGVSIPETTDKVTIGDLSSFVAPVRYLGTNVGTNPGDARWDLSPGPGPLPVDINVIDLSALVAGQTGNPPMFGGARAFNGPTCTP